MPSFLGRLAASRGATVRNYAVDLGTPLKSILEDPDKVSESLAHWGKLDRECVENMISWTGVSAGPVQLLFRGEICGSRSLRNPIVRGCPICLKEDMVLGHLPAGRQMALRGDWQYRDCVRCVRHHHLLVPIWNAGNVFERFDSAQQFSAIATRILAGDFDVERSKVSEYDVWLLDRLESPHDTGWLATQSVEAITTMSRLLGTRILGFSLADIQKDVTKLADALSAGFLIVKDGPGAFRSTLDGLAAQAKGALDEPQKAFGGVYTRLASDLMRKPEYEDFSSAMRDCIIETWPLAAGDVVLGQLLEERLLHSVTTAAAEANIKAEKMDLLLVEAGAIAADDDRTRNKKTFLASTYAALIAEIPMRVSEKDMRVAMGATRNEFDALAKEGIMKPRTKVKEVRLPWLIEDGLDLVAALSARAMSVVAGEDPDWETMQQACAARRIALRDLHDAIGSGDVQISLTEGVAGYHSLRILKSSVTSWLTNRGFHGPENQTFSGTVSLAEFGRSIGLRDQKYLNALAKAGILDVTKVFHPLIGRDQLRVGAAAAAAFRERFATVSMLATETGEQPHAIRGKIARSGLSVFKKDGASYGNLWLRGDVEAIARQRKVSRG